LVGCGQAQGRAAGRDWAVVTSTISIMRSGAPIVGIVRVTRRVLVCAFALSSITLGQESSSTVPTVSAAVAKNNLITLVQPEYPPLAKAASIAGKVRAEVIVDESGNVFSVKLLSGHPMLAPSAIAAIRKWKYRPFEVDGHAARVQTEVEVTIPENVDVDDLMREKKFQDVFWPNQKAGLEALDKNALALAESKLLVARSAAEERGPQKVARTLRGYNAVGKHQVQRRRFRGCREPLQRVSCPPREKSTAPRS
jgi:TonB family protein